MTKGQCEELGLLFCKKLERGVKETRRKKFEYTPCRIKTTLVAGF